VLSELQVNQVFLACGSTDMRKSIDGLAVLVKEGLGLDPFAPALFVFCNRQRDKVKVLHWEHNGFWLYYRRRMPTVLRCGSPGENCAGCSTDCLWSSTRRIPR